jgi:hypothetical protein
MQQDHPWSLVAVNTAATSSVDILVALGSHDCKPLGTIRIQQSPEKGRREKSSQ